MEQRHRRLVAASCCIWLFTVVALVSCQNAPDVAGLRGLATEGDGAAQFDIGDRYFNGEGVPQDNGEAVRWYRLAADQGHARAQARLGFMYFNGEGVPQDDGEAARWYRLAADQGYAAAQSNLGLMYGIGRGVPQDDGERLRWYRLAADQGHAGAQYNLGLVYGNGRGVPQDEDEAARWFRLAADQGHAGAQYNLGLMYGTGRGVPQDYVAAHKWANLAAAQGHENAREVRDTLAEAMNATQRAAREAGPSRSEPEDDLAEQLSSYSRRVQALQTVYAERIPHELEQLLLAGASLDAEEYSYRWAVYSATLDECILVYASLVEEARELQRSARRAGESSLALEMESGITAMETSLLGLREQRAEAEGTYQQMQGLLRQPGTQSSVAAPRATLSGPRIVGDVLPLTTSSGERCFADEICPSGWIQYEMTINYPGQGP